jgi:hypothetical protein
MERRKNDYETHENGDSTRFAGLCCRHVFRLCYLQNQKSGAARSKPAGTRPGPGKS